MKRYIFIIILAITAVQCAVAQTDRDCIRRGNSLYASGRYAEAEVEYRKAIAANPRNSRALYNLGCALQKEKRDSDAIRQYEEASKIEPNKKVRSQAFYNMGVAFQMRKDYGHAIEAYKNCLRLNPDDNDARYNYVLCKQQQSKQQQNGSNNKNQDNKDKNKNKNDKNQQDKNKNNKNQNKDNQQQNKDNQQNGDISRDNAEQMLQAAMNQEQETEAKLKQAMQQPSSRNLDKNW